MCIYILFIFYIISNYTLIEIEERGILHVQIERNGQ